MSPSATEPELVHGTAVALGDKAALIRGPSGCGKSDLALRCIATTGLPGRDGPVTVELVSDDQVRCVRRGSGIEVSPPPTIAGKMEVRGLGILELPYRPAATLVLVVDLVAAADVPRYPLDAVFAEVLGLQVPVVRLAAFESSSPLKLLLALAAATG